MGGVQVLQHEAKAAALHAFFSESLGTTTPYAWQFDLPTLYHDQPQEQGNAMI